MGKATYGSVPYSRRGSQLPEFALHPRTPLASLEASGQIAFQYIFRKNHGKLEIIPYYPGKNVKSYCQRIIQTYFATAVSIWHEMEDVEKEIYRKRVTKYGLVMSEFNLFISQFMKKVLKNLPPECIRPPRKDYRKLRRNAGRS